MKAEKIVFLDYPCMVVVCESINTPNSTDPETHDLREYAQIVEESYLVGFYPECSFVPAGEIRWTKHADMLNEKQKQSIEREAERLREKDKDRIESFQKMKESSKR